MPYGYNGKILRVDLTESKVWVDEKDENFYRFYMGGGAMGAYYVLNNVTPGTDAFDPSNIMFFGGSVISGAPISGFSRYTVSSVSPLTGGIADSEAGGYWAKELKSAGFDAIVVQGCSPEPVYLWVNNGNVEIKPASHLWGKNTGDAEEIIREENNDKKIRIISIGPAGENKVRFACIITELRSANGRGGLGAVMGSKNLKAIAVRGDNFPEFADKEMVKGVAKEFIRKYMDTECGGLKVGGSGPFIDFQNETGQLPTLNFRTGYFEKASEISGTKLKETMFTKDEGCFACAVRCKKGVKAEEPYKIDEKYGGPEYECLAALGAYTGVSDTNAVAKARELCNKYTLDSISTGATIAFAMDCYENGIITDEDTGGIKLNFGNAEALLQLIELITRREGFGNILAEGVKRAAEKFGDKAKQYAIHCKGLEFPAHDPRVKRSLALEYGTVPIGADHMASEHDTQNSPATLDFIVEKFKPMGIYERLSLTELGYKKVRFFHHTGLYFSMIDCVDICKYCVVPSRALNYNDVVDAFAGITGWETSLLELVQLGERRLQMMRAFNIASGMTKDDDMLPPRMFEPMENNGNKVDKDEYLKALDLYYKFIGWSDDGKPNKSRLLQLDLEWVVDKLPDAVNCDV